MDGKNASSSFLQPVISISFCPFSLFHLFLLSFPNHSIFLPSFVLLFPSLSLSFSPYILTPSHPTQPLSASLRRFFFFQPSISTPGATVCIHPVAVATGGGHMSGWMNKRPRDPHPQREWESERWRSRGREREREREREKENQISFLGEGFGVCGKWGGGGGWRGGGGRTG